MATNFHMSSNIAEQTTYNGGGQSLPVRNSQISGTPSVIPPALPPRPYQSQRFGGLGNTNGYGYGGYGYSNYGGYGGYTPSYGGYGGYGGGFGGMYGGGYNRMGFGGMYSPNNLESRFIQYAEESSRPAFQSIESVVGAFSGIAAMLDSTFMAMTTSFRAMLGVAENFGRLRSLFAQFWSTFAIFRTINWIYRKLLSMLGLSKHDPEKIQAWAEALTVAQNPKINKNSSTWPILMFLGLITSAPYIIYKLFGGLNISVMEKAADPSNWSKPLLAAALYDLQSSNPNELSLHAMQSVKIAPLDVQNQMNLMNSGWLMASVDNKTSGLVPANYVRIIKGNSIVNEVNTKLNNQESYINSQKVAVDEVQTSK